MFWETHLKYLRKVCDFGYKAEYHSLGNNLESTPEQACSECYKNQLGKIDSKEAVYEALYISKEYCRTAIGWCMRKPTDENCLKKCMNFRSVKGLRSVIEKIGKSDNEELNEMINLTKNETYEEIDNYLKEMVNEIVEEDSL